MPLQSVLGQDRALQTLRSALRSGSLHHAYLFGGPEGVGKSLAAEGLVQALFCTEAPLEGCGQCSSCLRIKARNHPDVNWVMPEEEQVSRGLAGRSDFDRTPSRDLKVEQIRKLQERLTLRALEGSRKVAVVLGAERMNPQAQNAFLKTLEEPPPGTLMILVASNIDRLLPTVQSRLSKVHFGPLPEELLVKWVMEKRKVDPPTARLLAVMSGGSLAQALALDLEGLSRRAEVVSQFEASLAGDWMALLRFAEEHGEGRDQAEGALGVVELWLRDVAALQAGAAPLAVGELQGLAEQTARRITPIDLHRRHRLLRDALFQMDDRNASPRLQLEKLLITAARAERRAP